MTEAIVKVDVPVELKDKFESAMAKVVRVFVRRVEFSIADDVLAKSKLTEEQAGKLALELKHRVAKRHGL